MSQALRKLTANASKCNCTILFLNQLRHKVGVVYGNPEITSGGQALKFYASVRLEVRRKQTVEDAQGVGIGIKVKAKVRLAAHSSHSFMTSRMLQRVLCIVRVCGNKRQRHVKVRQSIEPDSGNSLTYIVTRDKTATACVLVTCIVYSKLCSVFSSATSAATQDQMCNMYSVLHSVLSTLFAGCQKQVCAAIQDCRI